MDTEIASSREKIQRLLTTIDELQSEDSKNQLAARRAERDLREEREKALRLERELEAWKGLRVERGVLGSVAGRRGGGSERGSIVGSVRGGDGARGSVRMVEGAVQRSVSITKGFL